MSRNFNINELRESKKTMKIEKFNWGAFFFTWIWGLFNRTYITLIFIPFAFIPGLLGHIICLGLKIWFGLCGNQWAWKNNKWSSVEDFHRIQKIWAIIGTILCGFYITVLISALITPKLIVHSVTPNNELKTGINTLQQAASMLEAQNTKCKINSRGVAECFAQQMNIDNVSRNKFTDKHRNNWTFIIGEPTCSSEFNVCYVLMNNKKIANIYLKPNGYIGIKDIPNK